MEEQPTGGHRTPYYLEELHANIQARDRLKG